MKIQTDMIRLFSIEDHWLTSAGLNTKFRAERDKMEITCSAENMQEVDHVKSDDFDVILLDLLIPGTDPVDNVRKLKIQFPGKPIIILSSEGRSVWKDQMCEAGVQAYLTKNDDRKTMKRIIIRVAKGEDLFEKRREELKNALLRKKKEIDEYFIKPEEKEILTLYAQDMTLKEISFKKISAGASPKYISQYTIAKMMEKLRKRFNVKTNSTLIRIVLEKELIEIPNPDATN